MGTSSFLSFNKFHYTGFELLCIWSEKEIGSSMDMAELENATAHEADKWFIIPDLSL